ncbi:tyrosine-protein phosphatase 10D isoform X2 [Orussus abietinus]|uniref:tyrosine-protein phosphatase 10D isoform X2 n=1 Tax=Orussus abietinus TaxID=222816 RepID=UPI00062618DF|nr:tyrosine-protein phosphatase 10D isoform X2 [Orussus abietinus]
MIPRKRLQLLLYVLHVGYIFGDHRRDNGSRLLPMLEITENSLGSNPEEADDVSQDPGFEVYGVESTLLDDLNASSRTATTSGDMMSESTTQDSMDSTEAYGRTSSDQGSTQEIAIRVEDLRITTATENSLSVSWNASEGDRPSLYSISWCKRDGPCERRNVSEELNYEIQDLESCTEYLITVVPLDDRAADGQTIAGTTKASDVGDVTDLEATTGTSWISLSWKPPKESPNCVHRYFVKVCSEKECKTKDLAPPSTEYKAVDLEPCTKYVFTVTTFGKASESAGAEKSATTAGIKPGSPLSLAAESKNFSLLVHWKPPEFGAACVQEYRVNVWDSKNTLTKTTSKTDIELTGLKACAMYTIQVLPVSETGDGNTPAVTQAKTAASATNPPVLSSEEVSVSKNSISMSWQIVNQKNLCPLKSVITICNFTTTDKHGYELVDGESVDKISNGTDSFLKVTVYKLSPFTNYTCHGITVNSAGNSDPSSAVTARTSEDVPSPPAKLEITDVTETNFTLNWKKPEYLAGYLGNFEVNLKWEPAYLVPDWCEHGASRTDNITDIDGSSLSYSYVLGMPYSNYSAEIRAKTGAGWGEFSDPTDFQMKPTVPGAVSNLTYATFASKNDSNVLTTILRWRLPCDLNGNLERFRVSIRGTREGFANHTFHRTKEVPEVQHKDDVFSMDLGELRAEYAYTFEVATKVVGVDSLGPPVNQTTLYPAGIPDQPSDEYVKSITIDPHKAQRTTSTASILLPLFPNINGEIRYYAIMVSKKGKNPPLRRRLNVRAGEWPDVVAWRESMMRNFEVPYQATIPRWNPYSNNYVTDYGHMKAVKFVLGDDPTCTEVSFNTHTKIYCNGPLKSDTWYEVRIRAFTNDGFADSVAFLVKTNAEMNVAFVIGVVFGILILGIVTTMLLLVRKGSIQGVLRRFLHSDMPGSPVPAPFTRRKFITHCQQLAENPGKLSNEFQLLQTLSVDLQMPTNAACLQANRKKNRYSDILPYDFSRVKLEVIDNDPNTDYINASFIKGCSGEEEYIACQGPKEETTYDFWRMIDQYDVKIIVMLTQLIEKGKEKCYQYFPTIRETFTYESMSIRCTSELDFRTYTQRTLTLQKKDKKRHVTHLHFKDWPDHDVPEDFDETVNFCQIMRRQINANKGFVVIHCSAGIGRTGTLIALDILLQQIRDGRKLDVFGTVYRLRHHRINMVQRESQYAYIYNCIRQVLKNPYFLKTYKPPPVEPVYENAVKKKRDLSNSSTNLYEKVAYQLRWNRPIRSTIIRRCHLLNHPKDCDTANRPVPSTPELNKLA